MGVFCCGGLLVRVLAALLTTGYGVVVGQFALVSLSVTIATRGAVDRGCTGCCGVFCCGVLCCGGVFCCGGPAVAGTLWRATLWRGWAYAWS